MSIPHTVIPSLEAIADFTGQPLGPSSWVTVTQDRIDGFAEVTGDHQWIHTDRERAASESPWKGTIAHGYLTLSLVPALLEEIVSIEGWTTAVNAGIEKLRFSAPVPSGSRVRLHAQVESARRLRDRGVRTTFGLRMEAEDETRPAFRAQVHYLYLVGDAVG